MRLMYRYLDQVKNQVREHRNRHSMTQADLAAAVGVSRQTVISIESGRYLPSLPLAFRIAKQFDVSLEQLFQPTDEEVET